MRLAEGLAYYAHFDALFHDTRRVALRLLLSACHTDFAADAHLMMVQNSDCRDFDIFAPGQY